MNRTEEIEAIKRELFKIELALKRKTYQNSEEHKELLFNKREYLDKIATLQKEIELDAGQVGFAFPDLIEKRGL